MKFKAGIVKCWHPVLKGSETQTIPKIPLFDFTKYRIEFPEEFKNNTLHLIFDEICPFKDNAIYIFGKTLDETGKKRFVITLENGIDCKSYLNISWQNKIICNIIHKRYWPQRNMESIAKAFVTIISSIISGIVVGLITYNMGYNNGLKQGQLKTKSISQDTIINTTPLNAKKNYFDSTR